MWKYWKTLTTWTRRLIILCATAIMMTTVICAATSGSMTVLFDLIFEVVK